MKDLKQLIEMCNNIIDEVFSKRGDLNIIKKIILKTLCWILISPIILVGWVFCLAIDVLAYAGIL